MPHIPTVGQARLPAQARTNDAAAQIREWSSVIGIVTAIVGNILISFALNIQRYAHIRLGEEQEEEKGTWQQYSRNGTRKYGTQNNIAEERAKANLDGKSQDEDTGTGYDDNDESEHSQSSTVKPSENPQRSQGRKNYLGSPYWWAGIILMTVGEAGNFLAYGFAPASIVSPLGVVALVSNCIIAPILLKERFRQRDFWGVMVAIAGAVVVVLSAKNSETKMGPQDIFKAVTRWEFLLYLGITAFVILFLIWASGKYGERTILIDLGLVGLFGGYTALSTKGVASLLSYTLWRAFTFPITYLLLAVLVVSALAQIRYVNRALQRFDSTQVIPTQFVLFTISVIIGSAVLYRDFESATADRVGKFIGGCVLTFVGVYLITSGRVEGNEDQELLEGEGEEQRIALIDDEQNDTEFAADGPSHNVSFSSDTSRRTSQHNFKDGESIPQTPVRQLSRTSSSALLSASDHSRPDSPNYTSRPRALESTTSTPLLATSSSRLEPSPSRPSATQRRSDRPSALSRQSMARLMPGPLSSPLSSPLSAIVADSLRRGVDTTPSRARHGHTTSSRMTRSRQSTGDVMDGGRLRLGHSSSSHNANNNITDDDVTSNTDQAVRDREAARRLSSTLGDLFRTKRERSSGDEGETGGEPG